MNNYCGDCKHLSITEREQNKCISKTGICSYHICNKYNKQVKHFIFHPNLLKLEECEYVSGEQDK